MPDLSGPPPLSGGELVAQSAASEPAAAAATPTAAADVPQPQSDQPTIQPRPAAESAAVENEAAPPAEPAKPSKARDRFQSVIEQKMGEGQPEPEGAKAESQPEAQIPSEAEETNPAEDEAATGNDELIDLDKLEELAANANNLPRGTTRKALKSAVALAKSLQEQVASLDNYGGKEGLDQLHGLAMTASNPNKFEDFSKFIGQTPHFPKLSNKIFWDHVDKAGTLDRVIGDKLGALMPGVDVKWADVEEYFDAVKKGEAPDLEEIRERRQLRLTDEERAKNDADQQRIAKLERDNAEMKRRDDERRVEQLKQEVDADWGQYESRQLQTIKPHAQKLGMLIDPKEPQGIQNLKAQHMKNVLKELDQTLREDEDYQALWKMNLERQTNQLGYTILKSQVVNKAEALFRKIAKANQPFLTGAIKTYNEPEARAVAQTPKLPAGQSGSIVTSTVPEGSRPDLADPNQRRKRFGHIVERESTATSRGARV